MNSIIIFLSIFLISFSPTFLAQQPYIRQSITRCNSRDNSTSVLGYTCNGLRRSCQAYLTFRSQPPYDSVSTISNLLSADPSQLAQLNSVPENTTFDTNQMVLVPITCSCSGQYYQANASYVVRPNDTYLIIANNTFQGLSTCQALEVQNSNLTARDLSVGMRITVPLRCACPTRNQSLDGVNYLLSYLIASGQFVSSISALFGVDTGRTLTANGLSEQDFNIYPFTTLLVPLRDPPTGSEVMSSQPPPPPPVRQPQSVPSPPSGGSSSKTWIYALVGVLGGLVLASVIGTIVFCMFYRKNRKQEEPVVVSSQSFESVEKPLKKAGDEVEEDSQDFMESLSSIAQSIKVYAFQQLRDATEDFSPSCWIKGSVYRGKINGDFAAIKKMNGDVSKEINLLNKINHFNLIRLSGVCYNEGNWYLVYEFASNGTLGEWIHHGNQENVLNWNQRLQIALDVATGLNYLHRYTSPTHVHKDLISGNILLDQDFRAKIANFGLARAAEGQEGQFALTRHIVGTQGYMAPEYLENGLVSPKLDVYAFGVLLLEMLTGKEVSELYEDVSMQLSEVLASVLGEENGHESLGKIMDPSLEGKYPPELALLLFKIIDNCLNKNPSDRPSMDDIFQSLSRVSNSTVSGEWAIPISEHQTTPT